MRTWFWTLLLTTVAVVLAVALRENTGQVLIMLNSWRIQLSFAFAVLVLVASFIALYVAVRVLAWFTGLPMRVRVWHGRRQVRRDLELLEQGWTELLEGRYSNAEKDLTKLLDQSRSANRQVLAGLSAARAAHALGEYLRRDNLLALTKDRAGQDAGLSEAVATAAADLYLDQGRAQQALDVLLPLQQAGARHVHTLRLLLRAYSQLGRSDQVFVLARTLSRRKALPTIEARALIETAAAARLRETLHSGEWQKIWKDLKSDERILPEVALAGATAFEASGQSQEASKILEAALEHALDPRLLEAYARCEPTQVARRLEKTEAWLQKTPEAPELLTTLGNLCLSGQLWGQAELYLTRSLARRSDARVHALLASLFDKLERPQEAAAQWRLATAVGTTLPVLLADSYLPAADVDSDPGVFHAEGLAYLTDSGFPVDWAQGGSDTNSTGAGGDDVQVASVAATYTPTQLNEIDEYFDSAPIAHLAQPAAVAPYAGPSTHSETSAPLAPPLAPDSGEPTKR
ncbi:MAG: heme biosynthesis HemY N-terminal domain-containing protein [Alcaligenaceae bacterium]